MRLVGTIAFTTSLLVGAQLAYAAGAQAGSGISIPKIYRCAARDAVTLENSTGELGRDGTSEFQRKMHDGIIIDTSAGALLFPDGIRAHWNVIQKGTNENDHVLVPPFPESNDVTRQIAAAATDSIRVRDWGKDNESIKFIAFELSTLITGTCEVVR
jgi:hypothetical protein